MGRLFFVVFVGTSKWIRSRITKSFLRPPLRYGLQKPKCSRPRLACFSSLCYEKHGSAFRIPTQPVRRHCCFTPTKIEKTGKKPVFSILVGVPGFLFLRSAHIVPSIHDIFAELPQSHGLLLRPMAQKFRSNPDLRIKTKITSKKLVIFVFVGVPGFEPGVAPSQTGNVSRYTTLRYI